MVFYAKINRIELIFGNTNFGYKYKGGKNL